jgi:hypothetical protein
MTAMRTPLPEPALKAFLDEVVVPLLVARLMREREASVSESESDAEGVSLSNVIETVPLESSPG